MTGAKTGFSAKRGIAAIVLVLLSLTVKAATELSSIYEHEISDSSRSIDDVKSMRAVAETYERHFAAKTLHLAELDNSDLMAAFMAAFTLAFYADFYANDTRDRYLDDMHTRFSELAHRGMATARENGMMARQLMTARRFDELARLRQNQRIPDLPPIPEIHMTPDFDRDKPGALMLEAGTETLALRNVHLDLPLRIVVVGACHLSEDAAHDIHANPVFADVFKQGNAIWVGSAGELDPAHMRQWNSALPQQPLKIAYEHKQWPGIDFSSSPNFHFFVRGRLIASHSGWQREGIPRPVVLALHEMGLLAPATTALLTLPDYRFR